jgi:glucose/arabinose dehydrogenase
MNSKLLLRIMFTLIAVLIILSGINQYNEQVSAQGNADWPVLSFQEIASNLDYPVHIAHAGDGSGRLFIVEQPGSIRIYQSNSLLPEAFLDIQDKVRSPSSGGGSEEGLLSVAFPPSYGSSKDHFYVYYTNLSGNNQVSRFSLSNDPNRADPGSEQLVIYFDHPVNTNHNGGQLSFGPDGYLYIGTGDGGGGGDPFENAQDPASLLGKILRIDVDMEPEPGFDPVFQL